MSPSPRVRQRCGRWFGVGRPGVVLVGVLAGLTVPGVASGVAQEPPVRQPERRPVREAEVQQVQTQPSGSYQVRTGDTLWDLARRYLSDPHRWRDIFELNTGVVEDPHWIFPGELLALPGQVTGIVVAGQPAAAEPAPAAGRPSSGADQEAGRGADATGVTQRLLPSPVPGRSEYLRACRSHGPEDPGEPAQAAAAAISEALPSRRGGAQRPAGPGR